MKAHPAADLFPLMPPDELRNLADDIAKHGLREPVWLYEGLVLDGRNRVAACELVDVTPLFREYTGDDPVGFSLSMNLQRRHRSAFAASTAWLVCRLRGFISRACALSRRAAPRNAWCICASRSSRRRRWCQSERSRRT